MRRYREPFLHLADRLNWQEPSDSNADSRFWRPLCYHYTKSLYGGEIGIRTLGADAQQFSRLPQ